MRQTDVDNKVLVMVITAFDAEGNLKGVYTASNVNRAVKMVEEIVNFDDDVCTCTTNETYMNEVDSNVTLH